VWYSLILLKHTNNPHDIVIGWGEAGISFFLLLSDQNQDSSNEPDHHYLKIDLHL